MYAVRKNCEKGSRKVLVGCEKCSGRLKLKMQVLYTEFRSGSRKMLEGSEDGSR